LLAFVCYHITSWNLFCCHELLRSCKHVLLLRPHGHEDSPKVVQSYAHHGLSN
jgi:hypothetical protein